MSYNYEKDWNFQPMWGCLLGLGVLLVVGVVLMAITADHSPRFYYIEHSGSQGATLPCVMAYRDWYTNSTVFCSDDVNKAIVVMDKMNASLPKK